MMVGVRSGVKVLGTKLFQRFALGEGLGEEELCRAAAQIVAGQVDADLGGGVIKQRLARKGRGKSSGYRTIVLFRRGTRMVFAYGFAKKDRTNVDTVELKALRKVADYYLGLGDAEINALLASGALKELNCDE